MSNLFTLDEHQGNVNMNIIEKVGHTLGRIVGQYQSGVTEVKGRGDAPLTDPTGWMDSRYWGVGLEDRMPRTKDEMVEQFQSWVYTCANLNAKTIASVPLRLYVTKTAKTEKFRTITTKAVDTKRKKQLRANSGLSLILKTAEDVEEVVEHPFLDLMQNVNPFANANDLWETTVLFLDLTGEAYWYMPREGGLGLPSQLWVVPSPYINPIPGESLDEFIKGYRYERGRVRLDLPVDDIVFFSYPNPKNQIQGFSCVQGMADAIFINSRMYEFERGIFKNRANVGGVFTVEGNISRQEKDRLTLDMEQKYAGAARAGKNLFLTGGAKFTPTTMTPTELNFIEGRKMVREEICVGFDVPISALVATDVNRANAEVADYRHAKNGIEPRIRKIEQKLNERIMPLYDERLFVAFDPCVPEDKEYLLKERETFVNAGIVTRDEVRSDAGRDPKGGLADVLWVNTMTKPIDIAGEPPQPPPQFGPGGGNGNREGEPDEEADLENLAERVMQRVREKLA